MGTSSSVVELALDLRTGLYRALSPLDAAYARVRGLPPLPPLWLRRHVGAARRSRYELAVSEGARQLRVLLGPALDIASVLDLGCGCGAMAPFLREVLPESGTYLGADIHDGSIAWCRRQFAHDPRCTFVLLPQGQPAVCGRRYDLVLAKSLFTHLLEAQASEYLSMIRGVLEPLGRVVLTALLFDSAAPVPTLPFRSADGTVRLRRRSRPEAAVGFERAHFHRMLRRSGLTVLDARYWFWPGAHPRLSTQDLLLCGATGP